MYDRIEDSLTKVISLAEDTNSILRSLENEPELQKTFYVPVFNMLIEGSNFLVINLRIVFTRYTERRARKTE